MRPMPWLLGAPVAETDAARCLAVLAFNPYVCCKDDAGQSLLTFDLTARFTCFAACPCLHPCRVELEEQQAEHERQLAAVMAKQSLLLEAQEAEATAAARELQASEAQHSLQQAQAARAAGASPSPHKRRLLQHLQEQHAADVARVLTSSIFAAVLARQHAEAAATQQGQQALSPGPVLDLPPGEHWLHDISGASTARTARTPLSASALGRTGSGSRGCRITAAAEASGSPTPSARRRLLAEVGAAAAAGAAVGTAAAAARDGPVHTPAVGRGELSNAAEAGGWPEDPGLGASQAAAATAAAEAATAEVARLEGELEEAAAECERCVMCAGQSVTGALSRAASLPACRTMVCCMYASAP